MARQHELLFGMNGSMTMILGRKTVPNSVIEAIQQGIWDYEPEETNEDQFNSTDALPGTDEKLQILAERLSHGKPLWHPEDRLTYADPLRASEALLELSKKRPR